MDADRLKLLLRQRAEALAPNPAALDRALARCARIGLRQSATSGRQSSSSLVTSPVTVPSQTPQPPQAPPILPQVPSQGQVEAVTVSSLAPTPAEPVPAGQLPAGRIIAGYRIEGLLGKGGMGSVYRATQLSMNRPVAFKVLAPRLAGDPAFVGRFRREARAAGRLHHPNLVTVHDSGEADGLVFFSMELVEGQSLKAVLKERGRLGTDEALRLARQALDALAYAHSKGVIHRDIKPDNLMLTASGQIKVADLGLSRIEEGGDAAATDLFQTSAGSFMGTPHYMAPEQGRDAHTADQRSDLYSLGATLYHLICGQPPFGGSTPMEVLIAAQSQPLAWPEQAPPAGLREFIARLMEKDPARRPADATTAIAALDRLLTPQSGAPHLAARRNWRRMLLTTAALVVAALMILVAIERVREHARTRTWNETLASAEGLAGDKRFAEAIALLHRARESGRDGSPRTLACDQAIAELTKTWDAWSAVNIAGIEQAVREHLAAGHYSEALATLRKTPESWRSPEAERRLDDLQRSWEEVVARDAEHRTEAGAKRLLDDLRERRSEFWRRAQAEPATAMQLRDGSAVFTASGRGHLPRPPPPPGASHPRPAALRLAWRGTPPASAVWKLEFAPDLTLVLRASGAELGGQTLECGENGSVAIGLLRRGGDLMVMARGRKGPLVLPVPGDSELGLSWALGTGELEATLGRR
jgi:hypothetical protein